MNYLKQIAVVMLMVCAVGRVQAAETSSSVPPAQARIVLQMRGNYAKAPSPPALIPLPPGMVKPDGWLLDWARTAANGVTSQLGERADTFRYGWTGKDFKAVGSAGKGLRWPLEQSAYWLDGLVRLAYILDDAKLKELARSRLDVVVNGVNNGGESFIWWEPRMVLQVEGENLPLDRFTRLFNNWAHAHMGRALVAYYQATGDPRILQAIEKAYANFPLRETPGPDMHGASTNFDPMLDAYAMSGDKRLLDRALAASKTTSFTQAMDDWNSTTTLGDYHTVLYYEDARVPAILSTWTGEARQLNASKHVLELGLRDHGLPVGICSAQEHLMGIGSIRGLETCNVAVSAWTNKWMLQITGDGQYGDQMEEAILNAGPASISRDFDTACYFQTLNRIDKVVPIHVLKNVEGYDYDKTAGKVLCCIGNTNRMIPDYVQHMWMATMDGGLAATVYGPNHMDAFVRDGTSITIVSRTNYPFDGDIDMTLTPAEKVEFPLLLRIPRWCKSPSIMVNGEPVANAQTKDGFVRIARAWSAGDKVALRLPLEPEIEMGKTTPVPDVPYFKLAKRATPITKVTKFGQPFATVHVGPLLFALAQEDKSPNEASDSTSWKHALAVDDEHATAGAQLVRAALPSPFQWQLEAPLKVRVAARAFDWQPSNTQPLPDDRVTSGSEESITLVPYGCTKFRISMFPVAAASRQ